MSESYIKLVNYALGLVAKKRYTKAEMIKKLKKAVEKWEIGEEISAEMDEKTDEELRAGEMTSEADNNVMDVLEKVIARLLELNYLDDKQYVKDYISDRVRFKPRGKFLISQELLKKGLPKELVYDELGRMHIDEVAIALGLLEKKKQKWQKEPLAKQKNKAYQFLASKGFGPDAIYKAVKCCYVSDVLARS